MTTITAQRAPHSASNFAPAVEANAYGMNERAFEKYNLIVKSSFQAEKKSEGSVGLLSK